MYKPEFDVRKQHFLPGSSLMLSFIIAALAFDVSQSRAYFMFPINVIWLFSALSICSEPFIGLSVFPIS